MRCREGRQSTPTPTSGRIQNSEAFQTTSASQESKGNLASARLHTSFEEDWGGHHKICLGSVPYSPDLPLSCFNLFGALKDAILSTKFETDEYVMSAAINWLREQGRAQNRQGMYTPAPCWERLCEKIGYGLKPTLFIMCNFRNLRINIYWKKIKALLSVHPS